MSNHAFSYNCIRHDILNTSIGYPWTTTCLNSMFTHKSLIRVFMFFKTKVATDPIFCFLLFIEKEKNNTSCPRANMRPLFPLLIIEKMNFAFERVVESQNSMIILIYYVCQKLIFFNIFYMYILLRQFSIQQNIKSIRPLFFLV